MYEFGFTILDLVAQRATEKAQSCAKPISVALCVASAALCATAQSPSKIVPRTSKIVHLPVESPSATTAANSSIDTSSHSTGKIACF